MPIFRLLNHYIMTYGNTSADMIAEILPDISFPCYVNGKELTATLTHIEDQYIQFTYSVSFSDGYKTKFLEARKGINPKKDTATTWIDLNNAEDNLRPPELGYLQAVKEDLAPFSRYLPLGDVCLLVMDLPGENDVKVWCLKPEESNVYFIHYQNKYRFAVERTEEGWHTDSFNVAEQDIDYIMNLSQIITTKIDETPTDLSFTLTTESCQ